MMRVLRETQSLTEDRLGQIPAARGVSSECPRRICLARPTQGKARWIWMRLDESSRRTRLRTLADAIPRNAFLCTNRFPELDRAFRPVFRFNKPMLSGNQAAADRGISEASTPESITADQQIRTGAHDNHQCEKSVGGSMSRDRPEHIAITFTPRQTFAAGDIYLGDSVNPCPTSLSDDSTSHSGSSGLPLCPSSVACACSAVAAISLRDS
jgi:hypothetical protein